MGVSLTPLKEAVLALVFISPHEALPTLKNNKTKRRGVTVIIRSQNPNSLFQCSSVEEKTVRVKTPKLLVLHMVCSLACQEHKPRLVTELKQSHTGTFAVEELRSATSAESVPLSPVRLELSVQNDIKAAETRLHSWGEMSALSDITEG